jgi:hypothetical protein
MKSRNTYGLLAGLALTIAPISGFAAPPTNTSQSIASSDAEPAASPQTAAKPGDFEELTQGPVHEAFAEPVVFDVESGIVVPKAPPDPIKEIQPQEKPEGANVTWIGGYWGWDAEKKDYLWVSGIWRVAPPDHQWKPGFWSKTDSGFQWISGFWEPTESDAKLVRTKLPKPPKSLEEGPSSPAPDDNHVWIPGYWDYNGSDYAWSGGYWTPGYADRVYVPSHYVYHPDGYTWVGGYWDYPVASRGFLFAPVYFSSPVYASAGYSFTPGLVISTGFFLDNMFAYPGYGHYYFGNYYDSSYGGMGIYPAYNPLFLRIGYSDVWEHEWWGHNNRHDYEWDRGRHKSFREAYLMGSTERFERIRANAAERPGRTFQQNAAKLAGVKTGAPGVVAARPFKDLLADKAFVSDFAKKSRQSEAGARQAILAQRTGAPGAVVPKVGDAVATPKPGEPVRETIGKTDTKTPVSAPVAESANKLDLKTDKPKPPTDDKVVKTEGSTPDRSPIIARKDLPVQTNEKADTDKAAPPKPPDPLPVVKSDRGEDKVKDATTPDNSRPADRKSIVRRSATKNETKIPSDTDSRSSGRSSQNDRSDENKKSGGEERGDKNP